MLKGIPLAVGMCVLHAHKTVTKMLFPNSSSNSIIWLREKEVFAF